MSSLRRLQRVSQPLFHSPARFTPILLSRARPTICRTYSVAAGSSSRLSPFFTGLLFVGVGLTAYGLYDLYATLTMWPEELRQDLRDAVKAKHKGDLDTSIRYFYRAWETTTQLPLELLKDQPWLKISGIAVALSEALESQNEKEKAYEVYADCLTRMQEVITTLSGPERLRAVAIAGKLGEVAEELQKPADEEEKWLSWGVEEVLRLVKDANAGIIDPREDITSDNQVTLAELELPPWVDKTDVGAPLEVLAAFYARIGKVEFAMPLYLQAISILIPPPPQTSSPDDQCRGAQMMGNLSELIIRGKPTPEKLQQAESWAKQSLAILQRTRRQYEPIPICEYAYAAALFNIGMLREMSGDKSMAREFYRRGLDHSKVIGMPEGVNAAETALRRVGGLTDADAQQS
ncbi:hypothetical protein IW261DRAFT_1499438 [Armillaria novae-zelandiae]|uniref:TPR repeat-containing protein P27G11.02 n=1 Tax=Armillaria novae-zelandiae TaxID=153914 RepID=A0AA39NYH8_9AGAR|nr:hypothetical protein IW261DRAFT_1499438 [Armillaria novae-zelandiae]